MKTAKTEVRLSFVGTGSAITRKGRYPSGLVLDGKILVDAPPQAYSHLKKMGMPPEKLEYVLFTHFHPDHVLGFVVMAQEWFLLENLEKPVRVIGPPGVENFFNNFFNACFPHDNYQYSKICRYIEIPETGGTLELKDLKIEAIPLFHSSFNLGYKIFYKNKSISISGDTGMCENLWRLLDSDAVVVEMTTVVEHYDTHMNVLEHFLPIKKKIKNNQRLFLYHLAEETEEIFKILEKVHHPDSKKIQSEIQSDNVVIAEDFKTYLI